MGFTNFLVFPGHKYLGPGNKLSNGLPIDSDDLIAQEHDIAYENANVKEDVIMADEIAIFAFTIDWIKNKNWHSFVGALGLSIKHIAEIILDTTLYPILPKYKKK